MRVLGLVTARGGSKGIPRKNARQLAGKPLLAYTAESALAAKLLTDVILSTDDEQLADLGRASGLSVPFMRPAELARDETPSLPVVQHALSWMESRGCDYDAVCLLQPTTPLRQPQHIDDCIRLLERRQADTVITVLPVPEKYHPQWVFTSDTQDWLTLASGADAPIPRRQELPPAYFRDGSVYVVRRDIVINQNTLYGPRTCGCQLDPQCSVNLDSLLDWQRADEMLRQQRESQTTNADSPSHSLPLPGRQCGADMATNPAVARPE